MLKWESFAMFSYSLHPLAIGMSRNYRPEDQILVTAPRSEFPPFSSSVEFWLPEASHDNVKCASIHPSGTSTRWPEITKDTLWFWLALLQHSRSDQPQTADR